VRSVGESRLALGKEEKIMTNISAFVKKNASEDKKKKKKTSGVF